MKAIDCTNKSVEFEPLFGSLFYTDDSTGFGGIAIETSTIGTGNPIECNTVNQWLSLFQQALKLSGTKLVLRVVITSKSGGTGISSGVVCGQPLNIERLLGSAFVYDTNDDIALHLYSV